jgi:hypothetical protein
VKLKLIAIALVALLAVTIAPTVVAAAGQPPTQLPTLIVRPVYAFNINTWTLGPKVGAVVFNTQTGKFMVVAGGLEQPPSGKHDWLGISFGPLPPSMQLLLISRLDVNSQGGTLDFRQSPATGIDPHIANGGVFVIVVWT